MSHEPVLMRLELADEEYEFSFFFSHFLGIKQALSLGISPWGPFGRNNVDVDVSTPCNYLHSCYMPGFVLTFQWSVHIPQLNQVSKYNWKVGQTIPFFKFFLISVYFRRVLFIHVTKYTKKFKKKTNPFLTNFKLLKLLSFFFIYSCKF